MIGADSLLSTLESEGVTILFWYPGGAVLPLYDRLPFHSVRHILVRHEQGAGFAAWGYARATWDVGVCVATSWPGVTNLLTAIADAKMDSVPIVAITGNVFQHLIGSDAFQEVDTVGIYESVVKHAFFVDTADTIEWVVIEAFRIARSGRPWPVIIDITKNAQADTVTRSTPWISLENNPSHPSHISREDVESVNQILSTSKRPVVIYGHGVILGDAKWELEEFLEKTRIPSVWTFLGIGATDETWERKYGMLGMHGTVAANYAVHNADCIIGIGVRFDDRIYGNLKAFQSGKSIIHFDIDPSEIGKIVSHSASVCGNVKDTLPIMNDALHISHEQVTVWKEWNETILQKSSTHALSPWWEFNEVSVIESLLQTKNDDDIVVVDVGQHQMWTAQRFRSKHARTFLGSGGLGTMGFSLPTAVGASYSGKTVWSLSGDGGFQMNIQELGTIMAERIPVKIIIIDNGVLGMVRQWQELFYQKNYVDTTMKNPDYVKIAEAYGIRWITVRTQDELDKALRVMKDFSWPILCHCIVGNENNVFPMVPAGKSLGETITGL